MQDPEFIRSRNASRVAFAALAALWVAWRLGAPATEPPPSVWRALEEVRAAGSSETGRIELRGWPEALVDLGLAGIPEVRSAAYALEARIDDANDSLAELAEATTARIEQLPGGPVGIRAAGLLIAFAGSDAEHLLTLRDADRTRARETLDRLADILAARLEEPPAIDDLEGTVATRELLGLHRTVRDAVDGKDAEVQEALAEFRRQAFDATRNGSGPFQRRGRGVVLETVAAALLGVLLRESLRGRPAVNPPQIAVALAPLAALGVVIGLAGTVIPTDPVRGLTAAFVPIAFATGWVTPGVLQLLSKLERPERARAAEERSRLERRLADARREQATPPARGATAVAPRPLPKPEPERLPFAPKRRARSAS